MPAWLWAVVAYACGTLPSPWLIARAAGRADVIAEMRRQDSPGDAHFVLVKRISKPAGVLAMVLDVLKGFVPALLAVRAGLGPGGLAWVGVAVVIGHSFAPFLRNTGGRGLTAAAGVSLAIVPRAMVGTGVIALVGTLGKAGGQGTAIGFGLLPVFAWMFGYVRALVLMALAIAALIAVRRLEGLDEDRREGVPLGRAVFSRLFRDLPKGKRA
jgi:glycerol-3-phosphate acyltransferase PlsY